MKKYKSIIFSLLLFSILATMLCASSVKMDSPVRPMRKMQIFVTQIDCWNMGVSRDWYSLTLYPEYLRLFEFYGDELTQDSVYEDWNGGSFLYPPGIAPGAQTHSNYNNLYCDWSLCMDFNQEAISSSGEVYLKYELKGYKGITVYTESITHYYHALDYDTQYTYTLQFGQGYIKVYIEFQLLS